VVSVLLFGAVAFSLIHVGIEMKRINAYQTAEIDKLQAEVDKDQEMVDSMINDLWKLQRDTDYLVAYWWLVTTIIDGTPLEVHPIKNLNIAPYATIYVPATLQMRGIAI
jgi:hypothetical protein